MKHFLFSAALLVASTSLSFAADKVYFLNNGPVGSSGHSFYTLLEQSIDSNKFDIEVLSFDGCAKIVSSMEKIGDANIITDVSTRLLKKDKACAPLATNATKHMFADYKVGVVFKRANSNVNIDTDGARIAYNKGRNHIVTDIANNADYIEYKKSSQIINAVISGEADIGIVNSAAKVFKNSELLPMYNTSPAEVAGIPSLTSIGGGSLFHAQVYTFSGDENIQNSLRDAIAAAVLDTSSPFGEYNKNNKGSNLDLNLSRMESFTLLVNSSK